MWPVERGGRPVSSCSAPSSHATAGSFHIRPQIERVTRVKKRQKAENLSAAGCSLSGGESCLQLPNRAAQTPAALSSAAASSPNQPMRSRCRSTVRVGAARRGGDLWSLFHEPTFVPLRHQKGLSVRAGSQRAKESPLLCSPPPPPPREERPGGGAEFPCFFFYTACYFLSRLSNSETRGQTGSECYWAGVHADD